MPLRGLAALVAGLSIAVSLTVAGAEDPQADVAARLPKPVDRAVDFQRDVQPIFAAHCVKCHGADKQQGGLRLDQKDAALLGGDTGKAFEPKQSSASLLIEYVAGIDPDVVMPPSGPRLSDEQVGILRAWIDQGATWPAQANAAAGRSQHWSFQPLTRPNLPTVKNESWIRTPVDAFILARLEQEQVAPSPEADRPTLIRRLYLDLLGLLPTPADVERFVKDEHPQAYERLVEEILASPHFGERWGRHWLDLARYADSDGYEKDSPRPYAYRYRDWVIDAINRDLPYDQFTIEQLAGDLLPDATLEQRMATGFHRNTLTNREGGVDQEEFRVAATVDRVNTLGAVWLGLTVGCAQCHTHKYDPLTQREYYQLFAFFNSIDERDVPAPTEPEADAYAAKLAEFTAAQAPLQAALQKFEQEQLPARQAAWEQGLKLDTLASWQTLEAPEIKSEQGAQFALQKDGSWLVSGPNSETDAYTLKIRTTLQGLTGLRIEALPDPSLGGQGPGRTPHGNYVLTDVEVFQLPATGEPIKVALKTADADFEQGREGKKPRKNGGPAGGFPAEDILDGNAQTGWAIANQMGRRHVCTVTFEQPVTTAQADAPVELSVRLIQHYGTQHTLGRFRLSATTATPPLLLEGITDTLLAALKTPAAERAPAQQAEVLQYYKTQDPELQKLQAALDQHEKQRPPAPATQAQVVAERQPKRDTHIMVRGDFLRPGDEVTCNTPAVLPGVQLPAEGGTRLELARWLVSAENPLTPRVTVNLWWQYLFSRGLVATVEDFGTRGELPSHPELLDWLASELIARNWSRKEFLKVILHSATYRQSSDLRPELEERDPKNIWLARQNRFRVESEVVRDLYLSASGLLDGRIGGPSVRPPLPPGVAELGYAGSVKWPESKGADKYRRGLYVFFQRTVPYPMLMSFDMPDSNTACVRRERSNTPLQALTLLNDPVFVECAQKLGQRVVQAVPEAGPARWQYLVQLCLSRAASPTEIARLQQLQSQLQTLLAGQPEAAKQLAAELPAGMDPTEVAVAVAMSRVVMNLDEFLVRP